MNKQLLSRTAALAALFLTIAGNAFADDEVYDFGAWTKKSGKAQTLDLEKTATAADGSTTVYQLTNFLDKNDANHSLNDRFYLSKLNADATASPYGWTKFEGYSTDGTITDELLTCGFHLRGKNGKVSIQNLKKGDVVIITHSLSTQTAETSADGLYIVSKNVSYETGSATKVLTSSSTKTVGNALVSGTEYTMTQDGSFDFQHSGGGEYYIRKVVIKPVGTNGVHIGSTGYATFSSESAVSFAGTGVKVYWASSYADGKVQFTEITSGIVPAKTGVLLQAASGNYTYTETTTSDSYSDNLLKNIKDDETKVKVPETADGKTTTNYLLAQKDGVTGFYKVDSQKTGLGGKACLTITEDAASAPEALFFDFGSETTGINEVRGKMAEVKGEYYTISGQRVAQPTKGLYIIKGKKVMVK